MKYSLEQLEQDIYSIFAETSELRKKKGHDYSGGSEDTLDNYRDGGWQYVNLRLREKTRRLKSFAAQNKLEVENETVEDTMMDIVNLSVYILIMFRQEKNG